MGHAVNDWRHCRHLLVQGFDFGDTVYSFESSVTTEILEAKVLHGKAVERDGGIPSYNAKLECYTDDVSGLPAEDSIGTKPVICFPASTGQHGGQVIFGTAVHGLIRRQSEIGQYRKIALEFAFDGYAYLGKVLRNSIMDASMVANPDTAGVSGSWLAMSTVASGKSLVTTVHLKNFVGSSIAFAIESDEAAHASPTTRATHNFSAAGASLITTAGPITPDTDYRVVISGTFTSASALVAVAIK